MRRQPAFLLCMLVWLLGGCNAALVGSWRSIEPARVPPDVPRIRQITFGEDSRFEARMVQNSRAVPVSGTYAFNGSELVLTPESPDGLSGFVYKTQSMGNVLVLTQNQTTYRLCREASGRVAPAAPALPEEPAQEAVIAVPDAPAP